MFCLKVENLRPELLNARAAYVEPDSREPDMRLKSV